MASSLKRPRGDNAASGPLPRNTRGRMHDNNPAAASGSRSTFGMGPPPDYPQGQGAPFVGQRSTSFTGMTAQGTPVQSFEEYIESPLDFGNFPELAADWNAMFSGRGSALLYLTYFYLHLIRIGGSRTKSLPISIVVLLAT